MLFKGNPCALVNMTAYFRRPDAEAIATDRASWERVIADSAARRIAAIDAS